MTIALAAITFLAILSAICFLLYKEHVRDTPQQRSASMASLKNWFVVLIALPVIVVIIRAAIRTFGQ